MTTYYDPLGARASGPEVPALDTTMVFGDAHPMDHRMEACHAGLIEEDTRLTLTWTTSIRLVSASFDDRLRVMSEPLVRKVFGKHNMLTEKEFVERCFVIARTHTSMEALLYVHRHDLARFLFVHTFHAATLGLAMVTLVIDQGCRTGLIVRDDAREELLTINRSRKIRPRKA